MMKVDDMIDIDDLKNLPKNWKGTLTPSNIRAKGYPFFSNADLTSFIMLFFDNLATIFGVNGAMIGVLGFTPSFVYSHFMGGACISFAWGNILYAFQASKVAMKTGNMATTAQPYGINPPASFQKVFGIILPCFWGYMANEFGKGPFTGGAVSDLTTEELDQAMNFTWSMACASNLLGGLFEFSGSFIGPFISRNVPQGSFLVPLSGVGITYLGVLPYMQMLEAQASGFPFVGIIPFIILWLGFFAATPGVPLFGKIPPALLAAVVGVVLFVIVNSDGYGQGWKDGAATAGQGGIRIPDFGLAFGSGDFNNYVGIGLTMAVSFTNFMGTFGCNISARLAGDTYSPMEMIQLDGLGTALGALLGSPYPTTTYIGHPIYRRLGACRGYSALNGIVYLIIGLSGLFGIVEAAIPLEVTLGQLACVGMIIVQQTFESTPTRWYPAIVLGLALCFSDLMINPYIGSTNPAVTQIAAGYVFKSFTTTWALMMLIDRWFLWAAMVFFLMIIFSTIGLQHSTIFGIVFDSDGHHTGATEGAPKTWKLIMTYALCGALCLIFFGFQKAGKILGPEKEDFRVLQRAAYSMKDANATKDDKPAAVPVETACA
jgi:AGZA family xanthine/uracil permease-like MFS transporter